MPAVQQAPAGQQPRHGPDGRHESPARWVTWATCRRVRGSKPRPDWRCMGRGRVMVATTVRGGVRVGQSGGGSGSVFVVGGSVAGGGWGLGSGCVVAEGGSGRGSVWVGGRRGGWLVGGVLGERAASGGVRGARVWGG